MALPVLVTGATGFLGPFLVERLIAHGADRIRCFVRPSSDRSKLQRIQREHPAAHIEFVVGNMLSQKDLVGAVAGVSHVYHLAAALRGSPADMTLNTVVGSKRLIKAIGSQPIRVVLVSSFAVYGVAALPRDAIINESTPLEMHPEKRDVYAQTKLRQELLFREYQKKAGFELVVLRPGVIYGPGGGAFSVRVGLQLPGLFLHLGGSNHLPLSYVENCAEAIAVAGTHPDAAGETYNVHDDDLPSASQYLRRYRRSVKRIRRLRIPYYATRVMSALIEWYHERSRGQMPAVLTPYRTASVWKPQQFDNMKLKAIGWRQSICTNVGMHRALSIFSAEGN
jgi:nucleoside-diphosphate-sugar epimerase